MENLNTLQVANSPAVWALAALAVAAIVVQVVLYTRLAYSTVKRGEVKLTSKQCNKAFRAGVVSAIGPAFGVSIVMIGIIAILGGPMAWLRLSVIGGNTTELTAASVGVTAAGGDISNAINMLQLSNAWWTMSINACGWLIVTLLFANRMEKLRTKIGGGDTRWLELFSSAATLGIFGAFVSDYIVSGVKTTDYATIAACLVGGLAMWVILLFSKKHKWIMEYSLGIAMIFGILAGAIL